MKLKKSLLKEEQYKTPDAYRSRISLLNFATPPFDLWEWTAQHYDFSRSQSVLEVGCGTGDFWMRVKDQGALQEITLTDFSEGMLKSTRDTLNASPLLPKMRFEVADVENLPYKDQAFDVVLAHLMLYHPKSQEKALNEICRVLKKDGWAGISTMTADAAFEITASAHRIDSRIPERSVVIAPFTEEIADALLPRFFGDVQKHKHPIPIRIPTIEPLMQYMRTHPVAQNLKLTEDFFSRFEDEVSRIINEKGYFATSYTPVLYLLRKPRPPSASHHQPNG